jgi:GxxExxY protein
MPIHCAIEIPRLSKKQFGEVSYRVMKQIFAIHREFGRLFDERIYKQELALRMPGIRLEVPVDVTHRTFTKRYFLDVVTAEGALFEFKTVEDLVRRHFAQLLHYLLLLDLAHGKLVNLRTNEVKHEFVNAALTAAERRQFTLDVQHFDEASPGAAVIEEILVLLLEDIGTGLELALYEEVLTHFLGGESAVERDVSVLGSRGVSIGTQRMRLCAPEAAFKLTTFAEPSLAFGEHCKRLLQHLPINAIQWVNIANHRVTFTTLKRRSGTSPTSLHEPALTSSSPVFLP